MNQQAIYRWIIVGALVLAVAGLIVFKVINQDEQITKSKFTQSIEDHSTLTNQNESYSVKDPKSIEKVKSNPLGSGVLAVVNLRQITEKELEARLQSLSEEYQSAYKKNKEGLLDQLIIEEVLYQEAEQRGMAEKNTGTVSPENKMMAIRKLITAATEKVTVTEKDAREFYDTHPAEVEGASYDEIKEEIKKYLVSQKQNEIVDKLIADSKQKAQITINQAWLNKQAALKPQNPLTKALKNGKPTVLDLGSGTCIPCKMMKPIFEELEKEYGGKANIILLEINNYRDVANQYQVRVIPTQVFFDRQGNQVWRHEGFLAKEDIVKKLKELGAN